ncbi:unnamed protein product [Protopolystoma xenopodis]|uniref:AIMP2 thioredoxin-like domain-containing protein n=1 Tax=Protopolystoma xenopodis TaxID=117903 RepID=A0A448WM25_9PLAT|nr:unnamed protein product [Protopolystoma xenopodis]
MNVELANNESTSNVNQLLNSTDVKSSLDITSFSNSLTAPFPAESLDIAVHADPSRPPVSLFFICQLLRNRGFHICLLSYVHSLCPSLPERVKNLLKEYDESAECSSLPVVKIHLIWGLVPLDCQIFINSFKYPPLYGESMLLRLLLQHLSLTEETPSDTLDSVLAIVDSQILFGRSKDKNAAVKRLTSEIYFGHATVTSRLACPSLLDAFVYSSLVVSHSLGSLPDGLKSWMKMCSECPRFSNLIEVFA